jgi:transposase-like protein
VEAISPARMAVLARALEGQGLGRAEAARLCDELAAAVERCRVGPLPGPYPYVYLDGQSVQVVLAGRPVTMLAMLAAKVEPGRPPTVLDCDVGPSDDRAFWLGFLRRLAAQGLGALPLVAADGPEGIAAFLASVQRPGSPRV